MKKYHFGIFAPLTALVFEMVLSWFVTEGLVSKDKAGNAPQISPVKNGEFWKEQ